MKTIKLFILIAVLAIACNDEEIRQKKSPVTFEVHSLTNLPDSSYVLAIVDESDKFEQVVFFSGLSVLGTTELEQGDQLEIRVSSKISAIVGKEFDIFITDGEGTVQYLKQSIKSDCSCYVKHTIR